jgi:hypothetical protein
MKVKNSILLHEEQLSVAMGALNNEQLGEVIRAFADWSFSGKEYSTDNGMLMYAYKSLVSQAEVDIAKYKKICERNRLNGQRGGRPRNPENPVGFLETQTNPTEPKKADNDKDNDKDKDNDIITIKEKRNIQEKKFDFKSSLIDMGVDTQVASDWLQVRKNKRASNTKTAFTRLKSEIEKICAARGMTPTEVVSIAVERSWQGIKAEWIDNVTRSAQASLATTQSKVSAKTTEQDWLNGWIDEQ